MYMKILEYFLESLHLHQFLHKDTSNEEELKNLSSIYVEVIKSWMKVKEDAEWRLFASMFPILTKIFPPQCVLFPLWDYILNEISDLKESLTSLSIVADVCFTSSHSMDLIYIHHEIYSKSTFWLLILEGLRSSLQQYRKQALYIMKKAIDSIDKVCIENLGSTKAPITPFICNKSDDTNLPVKQKFFLVYEALEEKQYHLVAPALTHVASLVKANREHKSCNECFNVVWLQCVFEKILQHENNNVAKWGVYQACKLDDNVFNDKFLELFVSILNNTFLYECQPNEEYPEIVKELSEFLKCAAKGNLLNKFFDKVSRAAWGPVAIFYVMHTLRTIPYEKIQHGNWQANELNAVKSLVETNLNMHSHVLRTASQIELLRAIPKYVQKIDNLVLLANTVATFPAGEGLVRGTIPWNDIAMWLQKVLAKTDAITFVQDVCTKYLTSEDVCHLQINPRTFALMIYLLYDADLILSSKMCPTMKALNNWLFILNAIDVRPYADMHSSINVVEFISHLMNLSNRRVTEPPDIVMCLMSLDIHVSFKFLIKHMKKMTTNLTYENYTRYIIIISTHIANANLSMPQKDVISYTEKLQSESIRLLENIQQDQSMQYLYGLHVLHLTQDILVSPAAKTFYTKYLLNVQANLTNISNDVDATNLKGKITSEYYLLLSKLMRQYLINSPVHSWLSTAMLLNNLLQFLELGGTEIISEIATILTIIVDNKIITGVDDTETLKNIFALCWRCIFASKKNNTFWLAIENLMGVIINDNFFLLPNVVDVTAEHIDQLTEEGDNIPRFKRIILSKLNGLNESNLMHLEKPLLSCLLHGPVLRRDKRVENHAHLFIAKHLAQYYPKHILALNYNNDAAVRAQATVVLHRIISYPELNYLTKIMSLILEILEKYKNKRYFNDSYLHKLKHRLMQILLILEPILNEELVVLLQEKLCDLIFSESNQHSVRLMQEWLMIRILAKNTNLHDKLWKFFAESIEKRPGCTISVASIIYHVARLLSSNSQQVFIRAALPYIAQCCLGQQYNMRLYNQFILVQLYELIKADGDHIISEYNGIYQAAVASLQQGSLTKNSIRIQDDFYFSSFHAINNYSLQTIFFELPRLTNVSCDEWITPNLFEAFTFERNNNHPLQLYNIDSFLSETKVSIYLTKPLAGDTDPLANNIETYLEGLHDIQKKIDPSKITVSLYNEIFEEIKESICQQQSQLYEKSLIVVASFVSRPPNLGGIARTCEIFGVKTLVVANLDCIKDKEFQCLSVSAEKWINMLQVKPHELQEYLLEKKNAGWSLIGVEQTANSVNLVETKFMEKTVLVLGNEKDGIPANFVPLFDACVEIPQVGVIRSLNVHVTAAICIWQYASQHTLK
ncbi:putative methyltransferase TARBP1 [Ooceraea biroi]|uniref:tRNA (guanosine(18)-2'-O)-methyltransferase TARBP1 n=1 Tax=Ooceraea biroi TaxID=2015173 RepID=A0A026WP02_OOCBI|nr:putative methyltransferase TARBP1 [Ooceraea biroi]